VTPYEYGYLAMDYNPELANATDGAIANWSFPGMAAHAPWAAALTCEDPTTDITGEEFLLWEIAFYSEVLHQPWEPFWQSVDGSMQVAPDWTTAFNDFSTATSPAVIPSYSLDPAYAAEYGGSPLRSTVGTWNGTSYGWETVYGSGIVRGSTHLGLDQDLLRWLLNASVESAFPLNEWEYPANATVAWPAVFQDGIPPASIIPLDAHGAGGLVTNLSAELDEWQSLENGPE
jgi:ABC-type thiamine transport system substrate-binding protein